MENIIDTNKKEVIIASLHTIEHLADLISETGFKDEQEKFNVVMLELAKGVTQYLSASKEVTK